MKSFFNFILVFSLILMSVGVGAESGYDLETSLTLRNDTMLSGEKNHLVIGVKSTGPKTVIEDLRLVLSYDELVQIDEKFLENNLPNEMTSDFKGNSIQLNVSKLEAGKYYEIPVVFSFENGIIKDGSEFTFKLETNSREHAAEVKTAVVEVKASSPLKINKSYEGLAEEGLEGALGIAPGLTGKWKTRAIITKSDYGQMFIEEGTNIVITENFDYETLEFVRVDNGVEPTRVEEGMLVWEFVAPSIEEQKTSDTLFFKEFDVIYRVREDVEIDRRLDNQGSDVVFEFTNIKGEILTDEDEAKTHIYPAPEDTPEVHGNWNLPGHYSPFDGFGNMNTDNDAMNKRPTVYEWATLTYGHYFTALDYGEANRYKKYDLSYFINPHLKLEEIKTPGRFRYKPNAEHGEATYLEEQPDLDVLFYDENNQLLYEKRDLEPNTIIKRSEILKNHSDDTKIAKVVYSFSKFVPGLIVYNPEPDAETGYTEIPTYTFTILPSWKEDAVDNLYDLKNELQIDVERAYPIDYEETYYFRGDGNDYDYVYGVKGSKKTYELMGWHFVAAPRWATVTEVEEAYIPTLTNPIELKDHKEGIIYPGSNILQLTLNNEDVAVGAMREDTVSYFTVPNTVELDLVNIDADVDITELKEIGSYKLYKVDWNNDLLVPRTSLQVEINVEITDTLQNLHLTHYSDIVGNDEFRVLKVDNPTIQDTIKVRTPEILLDYIIDKDLILSKNYYTVLSDYFIEVEKFIKAESDSDYKKTTTMNELDIVSYRLDIKNKKGTEITKFALMDILPHVGDLGISNLAERDSQFDLSLADSVKLDERFTVYYSTSKNPSRSDLNNLVEGEQFKLVEAGEDVSWITADKVEDWSQIYSFLIVLNEGEKIDVNEVFNVKFDAQIPEAFEITKEHYGTYAHNSFAITANGSPVIEPLQVSVKLDGGLEPKPEDPKPEEPKPEEPKPEEPKPEEPKPEEPKPEEPKPEEPKPGQVLPATGSFNIAGITGFGSILVGLLLYIGLKKEEN